MSKKIENTQLPNGWVMKKLGEVCDIFNGGTPKTSIKEYWDGDIYWITPKDMGRLKSFYVDNTERKITNSGLKNSSAKVLPTNSIILSSRAPIGHLAINKKPMATNQGCKGLVPSKYMDTKYIFYFLKSNVQLLNELGSGTTFNELSGGKLGSVEIPVPPLAEQQRIVAYLDQTFAALNQAKANLQKNLQNAKELFETELRNVFENGNWETKTIQEVTKVINGFAFSSKDFKPTNSIKSIKITNVGVKEFVEETDNYLPESFTETMKEVQVKEGNIVIALTRTIISAGLKVAVVPASYDGALVNQRVAAIVPNEKIINQRYLYNFLNTNIVAKYVLAHVNTLMQPNLSINDLKNLQVPLPNLKEQQEIVAKLDALKAQTQQLETLYQAKLNNIEELYSGILKRAFEGNMQSPEGVT